MSTGSEKAKLVLVTGASGFIGYHICNLLAESGFSVRALVRPTSNTDKLSDPGIELVVGDIEDRASLEYALADVDIVVHAAADTTGSKEGGRRVTIDGTRRLVELCSNSPQKFIYISSCSVYQLAGLNEDCEIDESSKLEENPLARGHYTWAKYEAETIVMAAIRSGRLNATCLRPGFVYGDGGDLVNPMIGFLLGDRFMFALGSANHTLPAVHVLNVASAVAACIKNDRATGGTFNVVDVEPVTKGLYLNGFVRPRIRRLRVVYVPLWLLKPAVALQELLFKLIRRRPLLTSYRLMSSQNAVVVRGDRIQEELGWRQVACISELAD